MVGDVSTGAVHSSWPLTEDGNYSFWVNGVVKLGLGAGRLLHLFVLVFVLSQLFADPYKALISKEDGSEVEEDVYEAYNLTLVRCLPRDDVLAAW